MGGSRCRRSLGLGREVIHQCDLSRYTGHNLTAGRVPPPEGKIDRETFPVWAAQQAIAYRKRQGEQLLDTFTTLNAQLHKLMTGLRPQDWEKPCYHPLGRREVKVLTVFRAIELSMHAWDIQSVLEPSASLLPESLPILMERIPAMLSGTFQPDTRLRSPIRYRFLVTGAVSGELDLVIDGDRLREEPVGTSEAQVTCRSDTETFALLMFHRLSHRRPSPPVVSRCKVIIVSC
jgi:hypothetical protein